MSYNPIVSKLLIIKNIITSTPNKRALKKYPPYIISPRSFQSIDPFKDNPTEFNNIGEKHSSPTDYITKDFNKITSPKHGLQDGESRTFDMNGKLEVLIIKSTSPQYANLNFSSSSGDSNNFTTNSIKNFQGFSDDNNTPSPIYRLNPTHKHVIPAIKINDIPFINLTGDDKKVSQTSKSFKYVLGRGATSCVCTKWTQGSKLYAQKRFRIKAATRFWCETNRTNQHYLCELNALHLKHPNIVRTVAFRIYAENKVPQRVSIIMEFGGYQTLQERIDNTKDGIIENVGERNKDVCQIAQALKYCHTKGIIHMDVKPKNILASANGLLKLGDFGCSVNSIQEASNSYTQGQENKLKNSDNNGTWQYMAPETFIGLCPTFKSDIYSLGIVMWQLANKGIPYSGLIKDFVIYNVVKLNLRPRIEDESVSALEIKYLNLMKSCWHPDPSKRPSALDIIRDLQN